MILLRISDSHTDTTKILAGSEVTTNSYQGTFITKLVCLVVVTSKKIRSTDFVSPSTRGYWLHQNER